MVILIAGASHTGKTALAQRLVKRYGCFCLSLDHLKMGLIRSGRTRLTPLSSDRELTELLWPVAREMVKTAIENGQDLIVQKGTVFFNGPAENPSLDIEAIRNPDVTEDGVTAGIRVGGTASNPKVTLFSEPAKSQSETLSYLIRGQGLARGNYKGTLEIFAWTV